ncbi:MAG TPA: hypothetical protein PK605_08220 [Ignavibacteria bacterium]|nr:hypothetical protein [Bacteroidota bacterium]HRE09443.1 hypothetical protein [Ignavibacteria bacterium]HRF64567.1 hypothetical protein [Ignavibacteria bacterium]HRJ04374.1 hypothetical protein [Ignavibacteria bacterium]HRJ86547.1 hypothetical protein [Ignavibacteria bacterium]
MILSFIDDSFKPETSSALSGEEKEVSGSTDKIFTNKEFISQKESSARQLPEVTYNNDNDTTADEMYKLIMKRIEKERFERELIIRNR